MSQQIPGSGTTQQHGQPAGQVILPPDTQTAGQVGAAGAQAFPQAQAPSTQQVIAEQVRTPETKEFYKTSEFLLWGLGSFAVLMASGLIDDALDAGLVWKLISLMSVGYILSRGLAKAATRRGEADIARSYGPAGTHAADPSLGDRASDFAQRHIATRETKEFFKSSEFFVWVITTVGIFIATATTNEVYHGDEAWTHFTWVSIAYIVSRGLSKLGTRQDADRGARVGY